MKGETRKKNVVFFVNKGSRPNYSTCMVCAMDLFHKVNHFWKYSPSLFSIFTCLQYLDHLNKCLNQVLALVFVRKLMDFFFTKRELSWLDDLMPESKKKKLEDAEKEVGSFLIS